MAHISSLGAARFTDLSMALIPGGAAGAPPFQQMESIAAAISSGAIGLSHANALGTALLGTGIPGAANITQGEAPGLFREPVAAAAASYAEVTHAKQFVRITHIKEFPAMGTPANIVKVPVYGKKNSVQIQGQADAPTMELTLNYIPALWADGFVHGGTDTTPLKLFPKIGDGNVYLFRFTLMDRKPEGHNAVIGGPVDEGSIADDITDNESTVENTSYYFLGKIEALEVTPSLTDAITAKLTIAVQSEIYGAFTVD